MFHVSKVILLRFSELSKIVVEFQVSGLKIELVYTHSEFRVRKGSV